MSYYQEGPVQLNSKYIGMINDIALDINHLNAFGNYLFEITATSPRGLWVNSLYPHSSEGGFTRCLSVHRSVCKQLGFRNFLKKLLAQFISYLAFTLMGWVSWPLFIFVFLASFLALWWPNIWPKMGFPALFEKTIGSIHFIPGIYPYGVSLLTPYTFSCS